MNLYFRSSLLIMVINLMLPAGASAFEGRPYVGVQLGVGIVNVDDDSLNHQALIDMTALEPITSSTNSQGFAGRVFIGYQIFSNFGIELGYSKYSDASTFTDGHLLGGEHMHLLSQSSTSSFDALAVLTVPLFGAFSFNAKGGAALVSNQYDLVLGMDVDGIVPVTLVEQKTSNIRPVFGLGVDYELSNNITIGLAYSHTLGAGKPYKNIGIEQVGNSSYSPKLQLLSGNLKYTF